MGNMQWDDSLSVGVALIDEQHKAWIQKFNAISEAIELMQGPQRIAEALGFLSEYTRYHFGTEEGHMREQDYPGLEDHLARHEELRKTLADLEEEYAEDGATHVLATAIDTFVSNWLIDHIRQVDVKLGAFLRAKGVVLKA